MWNFLKSDQPESSMRVNIFIITLACTVLILSISFYIIMLSIAIFKGVNLPGANLAALAALIQWSPIVALMAGITALLSSVFYRKVQQTRDENDLAAKQIDSKITDITIKSQTSRSTRHTRPW